MRRRLALLALLAVAASLLAVAPLPAGAQPTGYVTMSDGVRIAVNVRVPAWCDAASPCPAIFEMSGYDGGSAQGYTLSGEYLGPAAPLARDSRQLTEMFDADYATIHASVRGSGCSGGEFDLFSWRTALDGYEIVEWIASQPWSNDKVGIMGHSYGGITGFLVGATNPPHLTAMTVSGLIDDLYRGIVYPGGVSNYGFPLLWTLGVRTLYDVGGGVMPGLVRPAPDDPQGVRKGCAENVATHGRTALNDPVVQGATDTDNNWWQSRALSSYAHDVKVPIHIAGAYQDEQTGPRGFTRLWEQAGSATKRLLVTNGDHGTNQSSWVMAERRAWMDQWMRGVAGGFPSGTSVRVGLETAGAPNGTLARSRFPLEDTTWDPWYLGANGMLSQDWPGTGDGSDLYLAGTSRQSWSYQMGYALGPPATTSDQHGRDELVYKSAPLPASYTIAGPVAARLYVSSTSPETDVFVQLADEWTAGATTYRRYLQRGMLRLSHRAVSAGLSDCLDAANARVSCSDPTAVLMYRPHRPHTNLEPLTPGAEYVVDVEVFPVGHVFRPGHRIVVKIHTPPAVDSYYIYVPKRAPAVNTIHHDAARPSSITLPLVPTPSLGAERSCTGANAQAAVRCVTITA